MEQLIELQQLLLGQFRQQEFYERSLFKQINFDNRITGVLGARGVGKTTFLLNTVEKINQNSLCALYISVDHIYFLENSLLDLVDKLYKETDVRYLCIDEVHKYKNWQQELKNISDFYLDFKVIFTGSSMIDIIHSKFDLSRRVTLYKIPGLSFREYLEFQIKTSLEKISLSTLVTQHQEIAREINIPQILKYFKAYLKQGYFLFLNNFSDELQLMQAIENSIQKTIYEDIATLHSLKTPTLLTIEKLYKYIVHSQPGELSAYKLASTLSKDHENISMYLHYLNQAGLVRSLHKKQTGKAQLRNPIKMYPDNTNFIYASHLGQPQDMLAGKVRETFVMNQLQNANISLYYSEHGDFDINELTFEIGGKNKTRKQLKHKANAYVISDNILLGAKDKIPLYLLGFLT